MKPSRIKNSLVRLGKILEKTANTSPASGEKDPYLSAFLSVIKLVPEKNPWFTPEHLQTAFRYWANALTPGKISKWIDSYTLDRDFTPKTIGIVTAGNIPLVGLHDMLSVLVSGHKAVIKMSSQGNLLLPAIYKFLSAINPDWKNKVEFTDGNLTNIDAVIATGSDNTARYFAYYFGKYPHIIRKNRNGIAVLTGRETEEEMEGLADDMMLYFGLGCRNVSKIFIPEDYDLNRIFKSSLKYTHYVNHRKYMNNFRYNKAVLLMSTDANQRNALLENGLILLKKDHRYASPVGVIYYETYQRIEEVKKIIEHDRDKIQVVVTNTDLPGTVPFGKAQQPELWDYADGVDTVQFLLNLN